MKAIILASGIGRRLKPLTDKIPKSLITINDKTIIERQIDSLTTCGIKDIIITVGPFEKKFKRYIEKRYPNLNIIFVKNHKYATTNYIYSLWLTSGLIDDDIILLHGDLIFNVELLEKLIQEKNNTVLINENTKKQDKDFKAVIKDNRITRISVELPSNEHHTLMPLYKFSREDFLKWLKEIDAEVQNGNINIYAEDAFNKISDKIILKPLYFKGDKCMEIDTIEDLNKAKILF